MTWKECDLLSLRLEFVNLASKEGANVSELCRRFNISRKTGYKWLKRYRMDGSQGLVDKSRRPRAPHNPTPSWVEDLIVDLRGHHSAWGPRKLRRRLLDLGHDESYIPSASTIGAILNRHKLIDEEESKKHNPCQRFERKLPNDLWQMDFKGEFLMTNGKWCYPLTMLDDHSRYNLCLSACMDQKHHTVKQRLSDVFRLYGLPKAMLMDNGSPWVSAHSPGGCTKLTAWLIRLDIRVINGRPRHPQTQGKEERFHRTLNDEVIKLHHIDEAKHCQYLFDRWQRVYNYERPHESLDMGTPSTRYCASKRSFPESLPPIEYGVGDKVRKLNPVGQMRFEGRVYKLSEAFAGHPVAVRPTPEDGVWHVYFCHQRIGVLNQHDSNSRISVARRHW